MFHRTVRGYAGLQNFRKRSYFRSGRKQDLWTVKAAPSPVASTGKLFFTLTSTSNVLNETTGKIDQSFVSSIVSFGTMFVNGGLPGLVIASNEVHEAANQRCYNFGCHSQTGKIMQFECGDARSGYNGNNVAKKPAQRLPRSHSFQP